MKAAVVARFGRNWSIEVRDVPKPVPSEHEVLVRARATTVSRTDWGELRHPLLQRFIIMRGAEPRTTLGMDFAGEVESAGSAVSGFKAGDRVFGMCPSRKNGAQAEYVCIPEDGAVALIPEGIAFDQAPVCEGAYYPHASVSRFCRPGVEALIYGGLGRDRHGGGAAREILWRRRHRGGRRPPHRHGKIARAGPGDRLPDGRVSAAREALRFRVRYRR
jgi:NADPH:quinone reductase-like Zn-dependent oxidoreductase